MKCPKHKKDYAIFDCDEDGITTLVCGCRFNNKGDMIENEN